MTFITLWMLGFFIFHHNIKQSWNEIKQNPSLQEKTDAIVVLTGGSERIRTAFHLLKNEYSDRLFISGVNDKVTLPELFALHKISKEDFFKMTRKVEAGFAAKNTIENAKEIASWINKNNDIKTVRVITSNYHIDRAMIEINNQLADITFIAHPVIPINVRIDKWWKFSSSRNLIIAEYNKLIAAFLRIYLEKLVN